MRLGIMQPYFFPYIGYFQLIHAVDHFIFYDDVNYIKNGWINRNRILINKRPAYISVQLKDASPFLPINEIRYTDNRQKIKRSIELAYRNAPFYYETWPVIHKCLEIHAETICGMAMKSVLTVCDHLNIKTKTGISSRDYASTNNLKSTERIMEICKLMQADIYINAIGGKEIYTKEEFLAKKILLFFLDSLPYSYRQFSNGFVPGLSIIDVLMFNGREKTMVLLNNYKLI